MTTALQIITKAMKKVGILTKTETPDADEANDALDMLNNMLSSWSNDSMMAYVRVWEEFPLTSNVNTYTIGTGQTFNTVRPITIVAMALRQNTIDYAMEPVSDEVYAKSIYIKTTPGMPDVYNYDNGYPVGRIRVWPTPMSADYSLYMQSEKELVQFTILNQVVTLPPGWERALIYNLAVELAPEYGQPVDPVTMDIAKKALANIRRAILKNRSMDAEPMGSALRRDILTDTV